LHAKLREARDAVAEVLDLRTENSAVVSHEKVFDAWYAMSESSNKRRDAKEHLLQHSRANARVPCDGAYDRNRTSRQRLNCFSERGQFLSIHLLKERVAVPVCYS
jgi:hypothetical protein